MAKNARYWFKPKGHSGFRKKLSVQGNVRAMGVSGKSPRSKIRLRIRQVNALANVTRDRPTERRARAVVRRLSGMLKKLPRRGKRGRS